MKIINVFLFLVSVVEDRWGLRKYNHHACIIFMPLISCILRTKIIDGHAGSCKLDNNKTKHQITFIHPHTTMKHTYIISYVIDPHTTRMHSLAMSAAISSPITLTIPFAVTRTGPFATPRATSFAMTRACTHALAIPRPRPNSRARGRSSTRPGS